MVTDEGGPTPKKFRNYLFLGKIFKFQGGGGVSGPPVPPSGSAHASYFASNKQIFQVNTESGPVFKYYIKDQNRSLHVLKGSV